MTACVPARVGCEPRGGPAAAGTTAGSAGRRQPRARPAAFRPPAASGTTLPGFALVMPAPTGDRARQGASGTSTSQN
jgi:hypothetical protein